MTDWRGQGPVHLPGGIQVARAGDCRVPDACEMSRSLGCEVGFRVDRHFSAVTGRTAAPATIGNLRTAG